MRNRIRISVDYQLPLYALAGPDWDTLVARGIQLAASWKVLTVPLAPPP
jgi:hypothetical protein